MSGLAALVRLCLPESKYFLERKALQKQLDGDLVDKRKNRVFLREFGKMLKTQWAVCLFGVILMT